MVIVSEIMNLIAFEVIFQILRSRYTFIKLLNIRYKKNIVHI